MANHAKEVQNQEVLKLPITGGLLTGLSKTFATEENFTGKDHHETSFMVQAVIDKTGTAGTVNGSITYADLLGAVDPATPTFTRQYLRTKEKLDDPEAIPMGNLGQEHYKRELIAPAVYVVGTASKDVFSTLVDEDWYNESSKVELGEQGKSFGDQSGEKLKILLSSHSIAGIYSALPSVIAATSELRVFVIPKILLSTNPDIETVTKRYIGSHKLSELGIKPFRQSFKEYPVAEVTTSTGFFSLRIDRQREHPRKDIHMERLAIRCSSLATICADVAYLDQQLLRLVGRRDIGDTESHELFKVNGFILRTKLLNKGVVVTDTLNLEYTTGDAPYGLPVYDPATKKAFEGGLYLEGYNSALGTYRFTPQFNCLSEQRKG